MPEYEFKIGQWVELNSNVNAIEQVRTVGIMLDFESGRSGDPIRFKPLTIREGDFAAAGGMTQEQWDRLRVINSLSPVKVNFRNDRGYLAFVDSEWLFSISTNNKTVRHLTIEQVMSTLEPEEALTKSCFGSATVKNNTMPEEFNPHMDFPPETIHDNETCIENAENYTGERMTQTLEYMIDVMTRAQAGEQAQGILTGTNHTDTWSNIGSPIWNWDEFNYRIKPREPRVIYVGEGLDGKLSSHNREEPSKTLNTIKFVEELDDD